MFKLLNFVVYQIVWFVCVLGAANGQAWIGAVAALIAVTGHLVLSGRVVVELKLMATAILVGFVTDSALMRGGFIAFDAAVPLTGWQPYWMLALWAAFATTLGYSMSWVTRRVWIAALAGAIGGPLAYWGGAKLGAMSILSPGTALPAIAVAWAVSLTVLAVAARRAHAPARTEDPGAAEGIPAFAHIKRRSHHVVVLFAVCAILAASAAHGAAQEWHFDVFLDGKRIGDHRFRLQEEGDRRELTSEAAFDVRILFINAYRYRHEARETWRGECIERVEARTDDNGKALTVEAERAGPAFVVATGGVENVLPVDDACVRTFAYWNPRILEANRLLNPQTGEYVSVRVESLGRERVDGREADRYRLVGTDAAAPALQIDLWYSPARDWLALESNTPGGRMLRYERR